MAKFGEFQGGLTFIFDSVKAKLVSEGLTVVQEVVMVVSVIKGFPGEALGVMVVVNVLSRNTRRTIRDRSIPNRIRTATQSSRGGDVMMGSILQ
jgi:hypothetical protein